MRECLALLIAVTAGCATTMQDAISTQEQGISAVYRTTEARAIEAAKQIFAGVGADRVTVEGNRVTGDTLSTTPEGQSVYPVPVGNFMAAWVEPDGAGAVRVTVVTKRRNAFRAATELSESQFHKRMLDILGR